MKRIRVLVADDSPLVRDLIRMMIEGDQELEVVGEASNGLEAVEVVRRLQPGIVTMDIEMPVLDGLQAIQRIMCENAVPILVVTTRGDAKTAYAAIAKGALDLVVKPAVSVGAAREFTERLRMLSKVKVHEAGTFESFLENEMKRMATASPREMGEILFRRHGCGACHSTDGSAKTGPSLRGVYGQTHQFSNAEIRLHEYELED